MLGRLDGVRNFGASEVAPVEWCLNDLHVLAQTLWRPRRRRRGCCGNARARHAAGPHRQRWQ